jgi:hypothetical protein
MIGLVRLAVFMLLVMTLFYWLLRIYSRSLRREKLEKMWAEEGAEGDRDAYVSAGLARYDASLRPRLIWGVYVVPTVVVGVIIYLINLE